MSVLTSTKWAVDNNHSVAQFKVRHLGVANITGSFKVFKGEVIQEDEAEADGAVDVTKAVTFEAELTGMGKGRMGDNRAGFEVDGKINRKDFGLVWSMLTESGGLVVGNEVKMHFDVELIRGA